MSEHAGTDSGGDVISLQQALEERYLAYALSTIMHRALPDVRDGLKPVHRRLLYAMHVLKLDPAAGFKKCARVVGDVIGKFHPHGDQAVYDAMVRLAQGFAVRYPLVEGQGNFGNIDGDGAAAYRYTEARLTDVAMALLEGLEEDAVDFRDTYNGEDSEPVVLPGAFPNLLANGSQGIAVGMATAIPPHNVEELCDAALHLIKHPNAGIDKLMQYVPGPDLPTGGVLVEPRENIRQAYETGRGGFRVRAKWEKEELGRGQWQIVVSEIPWQVAKARLVEKIADLLSARKLPLLDDVRDESAEDVRLVLVPKSRNVDPLLLMESLFRLTDLETRVSLNMNVLSQGKVPMVLSLRDVLRQWLEHRVEVLIRRGYWRLDKIATRMEVLEGFLIAYLNIDEVIRIVRFADHPKRELMERFQLTETQADAILNMRLRALNKLQEVEIRREHEELAKERDELQALLASEDAQWKKVAEEVRAIREKWSKKTELGRRRTEIADAPQVEVDLDAALMEKEPITVVCSEKGWIRALKGHLNAEQMARVSYKEGDAGRFCFHAQTTDKLLLASTSGRFYTLDAGKLPGGRGAGEPVRLSIDMDAADDIVALFVHDAEAKLLLASTEGNGFIVREADVVANTRKGKQVMNVRPPAELAVCRRIEEGHDHLAVVGDNRKLLAFPLADLPEMTRGKGVRLQRYKDGGLADAKPFSLATGLQWLDGGGRTRTFTEISDWQGKRATAGRVVPKGFPKSGRMG
ncbi:MAG TPA: DNA topoisomerase IV subunit A [Thermopetrobacter sp.]|nr:DNA topoisomerase IV subunit A [Thermopetrobacter sp.]